MANKLVLEMIADANPLLKSLDQAQKSLNKFVQAAGGAGSAIGGPLNQALSAFTNLAKGGGAAAGVLAGALIATVGAASSLAVMAAKNAEAIEQLSDKTGLSTESLQKYEVLLNRVGLSGDDLATMFKTLSVNLEQARLGTGTAADRFRQLGININTVTSTEGLLRAVTAGLSKYANGAEKVAIQQDLMGKSAIQFGVAMKGGTASIDEAAKASDRLGATLSGGQLAVLSVLDDKVDDLSLAWTRFTNQIGAFLAGSGILWTEILTNVLAKLTNIVSVIGGMAGIEMIEPLKPKPPPLIDATKVSASARALADAQLKASEGLAKNQTVLAAARLEELSASLTAQKTLNLSTDLDIAQAHEQAQDRMAQFTEQTLRVELANYHQFAASKLALFTTDEKGAEDRKKFAVESASKMLELQAQLDVATIKTNTTRIQSAAAVGAAIREQQIQPLQDEIDKYAALDQAQQALYASERGMLGASDAARRVRFALIDAEAAQARAVIEQTIIGEERKAQKILDLEEMVDAKRRQTIQAFPSFFESQMQAIVQSNAFSMSTIITTWTSGLANAMVTGGDFVKAAWQSTQIALIQGGLNTAVQWGAQQALMVAQSGVAAGATVAIWGGASAAIGGFFALTASAFAAMMVTMVTIVSAVGLWIMAVLTSIGTALGFTGFGAIFAGAVLVGVALIAAALAATGNLGFKEGGIGDFGSGTPATLHGPEAIIPLNSRGASFMQEAFGGGGTKRPIIHTHVILHGREIAEAVSDDLPSAWRRGGLPA